MQPSLPLLSALVLALGLPAAAEIQFGAPPPPAAPAPEPAPEPAPAPAAPAPAPTVEPIATIGPVMIVNGAAISAFEVDQRMAFLKALQQQGDLRQQAMDGLISDRLQSVAAGQLGQSVSDQDVQAGMTEFAARAQLSVDAFLKGLNEAGVAPETFRDFVKSGLLWRAATRAKFAGRVQISEAEIDRAIGMGAAAGEGRRLLLSELVIPPDAARDVGALAERVRLAVHTEKDFAIMARQFSKATTAAGGGELGWLDEAKLPPDVGGALKGLHPGEMTPVLHLQGGAVALYFLRDEGAAAGEPGQGSSVVDYAVFSGGNTGQLMAQVTGCDDLYAPARRGGTLSRQTSPEAQVPADLRAALASLDGGEARALPDGRMLMLCSRTRASGTPAARDAVRSDLLNRKVGLLAEAWLEELRFNAFIERP